MPIYEYRCPKCGEVSEIMHSMSDDSERLCEQCQVALEKMISASAFHLKGGGWYKDLYASTKKDGAAAKGSTPSSTPSTDSSGSSSSASSSESSSSSGTGSSSSSTGSSSSGTGSSSSSTGSSSSGTGSSSGSSSD